ncbi:MAG: hypothetical protein ACD_58C00320G0002 [uncultured bacterium]|nr:MAG: hypothetical protein ACD_58C00320G0002 [uncultured bacterium]
MRTAKFCPLHSISIKMKISKKYFVFGAFIGIGLLIGVVRFLPDGKLHVIFCDVGQGDATLLRMPNQAYMLVDGGPDDKVLGCLGRHLPFYARKLEIVAMTHPQKDHFGGLVSVLKRYQIGYFVTVPLKNSTTSFEQLTKTLETQKIPIKYLSTGNKLKFGNVQMDTIWPEEKWLVESLSLTPNQISQLNIGQNGGQILGFATSKDLNLFSLYLHLKYGQFDLLLTGDGDSPVQSLIWQLGLESRLPQDLEVLKVPHHGSKTGMTDEFINFTRPKLSVIEVGKNNYGHPNPDTVTKLKQWGQVLRTDQGGDIEVIIDGRNWFVKR